MRICSAIWKVGEDRAAGDADSNDPLVRLNRQMRQAEELLRARKSDDPTQKLQDKIVGELEELIKQLRQQQQQQSSSSSSSKKPQQTAKRESVSQPQQQQGSASAKPNPKPARDSSQRVRQGRSEEGRSRQALRPDQGHLGRVAGPLAAADDAIVGRTVRAQVRVADRRVFQDAVGKTARTEVMSGN